MTADEWEAAQECLEGPTEQPTQPEAMLRRMAEALSDYDEVVACPDCADEGQTWQDDGTGEPVAVQCEWCHTVGNSLYSVRQNHAPLLADYRKEYPQ